MSSRSGSTSDFELGWLLRGDDVLAAVESRRSVTTGSLRGVAVVRSPGLVHTMGCPTALDLAWCSGDASRVEVRRTSRVARGRVAPPILRGVLLVAAAGSFERWQLRAGDCLEIRCG